MTESPASSILAENLRLIFDKCWATTLKLPMARKWSWNWKGGIHNERNATILLADLVLPFVLSGLLKEEDTYDRLPYADELLERVRKHELYAWSNSVGCQLASLTNNQGLLVARGMKDGLKRRTVQYLDFLAALHAPDTRYVGDSIEACLVALSVVGASPRKSVSVWARRGESFELVELDLAPTTSIDEVVADALVRRDVILKGENTNALDLVEIALDLDARMQAVLAGNDEMLNLFLRVDLLDRNQWADASRPPTELLGALWPFSTESYFDIRRVVDAANELIASWDPSRTGDYTFTTVAPTFKTETPSETAYEA